MSDTHKLEIKIIKKATFLVVILALISSVLIQTNITLALVVGFFIGIFHFKLIVSSVKKLFHIQTAPAARAVASLSCLVRFGLLGCLFYLAGLRGLSFFIGVCIGFYTIKAAIILEGFGKRLSWKS